MSQPILDYPDWQRTYASARMFEELLTADAITTPTTFGPFPVGNMDSVAIFIDSDVSHGIVEMTWWKGPGATIQVTQDVINIREGRRFEQSIVAKGSWLTILATPATASWTLSLEIYETTRSVLPQIESDRNQLLSSLGVAVGAGATVVVDIPVVWVDAVEWFADSGLVMWSATYESISAAGAVMQIDIQTQASPALPRQIYVPARSQQVSLTNPTGVAGTISVRANGKPGLSGL